MTWILIAVLMLSSFGHPQRRVPVEPFEAVDVYIDTRGAALAAYQLEFFAAAGDVRIAGIEGGAHPAFSTPPFYDPKALQQERVILAAFSTNDARALPSGKTRVATIHLQIRGVRSPEFQIKLQTAANTQGETLPAEATFEEKSTQ